MHCTLVYTFVPHRVGIIAIPILDLKRRPRKMSNFPKMTQPVSIREEIKNENCLTLLFKHCERQFYLFTAISQSSRKVTAMPCDGQMNPQVTPPLGCSLSPSQPPSSLWAWVPLRGQASRNRNSLCRAGAPHPSSVDGREA